MLDNLKKLDLAERGRTVVSGAPEGIDARAIGALARDVGTVLHIARDDARLQRLADHLAFFEPEMEVLRFPAWDCLPYDRAPPNSEIAAERAAMLAALTTGKDAGTRVVLTTVSAALQRVPPKEAFADATLDIAIGSSLSVETLTGFLTAHGFANTGTVREPGEYAVRGGIVDIFPPDEAGPVRLDFFGDEIDGMRRFDPLSQTSEDRVERFSLRPARELVLTEARITSFRQGYRQQFSHNLQKDVLYDSISAGRPIQGMEHWLPLFFPSLDTIFDYVRPEVISLDDQTEAAVDSRYELIEDYYRARAELTDVETSLGADSDDLAISYHPLPPSALYLERDEWKDWLDTGPVVSFSPFRGPDSGGSKIDLGAKVGRDFADARANPDIDLFAEVALFTSERIGNGKRILLAAYSSGSQDRLAHLMAEHADMETHAVADWRQISSVPASSAAIATLPAERGFESDDLVLITEQDILGDRLLRGARRRRKSEAFLKELSSLSMGDLVVHVDHGIGRYDGLETLSVAGAPHDCLRVVYEGGDKLYVPVENMDVLSRFGGDESGAQLDRLGGAAWQARKAKVKERIREIAEGLISVAAQREMKQGERMPIPEGFYDEFVARFPFPETEDQLRAVDEVLGDLSSGRPMDRLICGDVGFGKTEVALRAAFVAVMNGQQVAVVVPTTLLARQHYQTFSERFARLPVNVAQISRLSGTKGSAEARKGLENGEIDIVVGTHALLGKTTSFRNLGLLIVDEEQHFGVSQKERLKQLRANVHVLTLTATPIPRTLQMALSGVRDLSLIATPPVDRLAVRTFVLPYDPVVIREAIMREIYRGGQVFYVCPRISDLDRVAERLRQLVPDVKFALAHGQMSASELEAVMNSFYDGAVQVLVSTNIIESGLDIPSANTLIVHRADRFGLAQLYQLRGRVGRSKVRAYAYLTLPPHGILGDTATRRLEVMQTLDTLGAGFTLASYDMDIRGAGNLLGEEQSGHIKEVGVELYQRLLEEAVANARKDAEHGDTGEPAAAEWTPQISIGMPVLIPEAYVSDLSVRLGLYRRIAELVDPGDIDAFAAELADRFGPLPPEVENLLQVITIKQLCRDAQVEKIDVGPKGAVISFHDDQFPNPAGLVQFIAQQAGTVKLRPDHKLVYRRQWDDAQARVKGVTYLMKQLASAARVEEVAAAT